MRVLFASTNILYQRGIEVHRAVSIPVVQLHEILNKLQIVILACEGATHHQLILQAVKDISELLTSVAA